MGKSRVLSLEQCVAIRERYEHGESLRSLGHVFDVAPMTAGRAVLCAGGTLPESPSNAAMRVKLARKTGALRYLERFITGEGYARVIVDESDPYFMMGSLRRGANSGRTVLEHRLVLARKLGRALLAHETVHHRNGNRLDNRPGNLELRVGRHGKGATEAHCLTCRCFDRV